MFKRVSRRVSAVLMASAIVVSNIIMPVGRAFATNTGTVSESSTTHCNASRVIQSIYTEDQSWRDTHPTFTNNGAAATSESGYLIEAYDTTTGDNGIMMHFTSGNPSVLNWRPAYQAMTAQDNVVITIPLTGSNWQTTAANIQNGVLGYKAGTTASWYDIFRSTTGSTPVAGATYAATTNAVIVTIPHMNAGDFWMSSYTTSITNPTVTANTGIFDSGRVTITSTLSNCDARTVIPLPTYIGTEICGRDNDTVAIDPTWLATWGQYVDGPWTDYTYNNHQIRGSANIKEAYRNTYVWASWNGKAGDWTSWRLYPGTEGGLIWTDAGTTCTATPCFVSMNPISVTQADQFADYQDTRATGFYGFRADGLKIWTKGATSTDKVAWYHEVNYPLSAIGTPSMNYASKFGIAPGMQIVIKANGVTGTLVGEPNAYDNKWWSNKDFGVGAGMGYASYGTLDDYLTANPDAQVIAVGFSLGSGVYASGILHSITFGCQTWTFTTPAENPGQGSGTPTTPSNGETPVVTTKVTSMLPAELPQTGANDTYGTQGLIVSLAAAVATYGAVFFARSRREM